jgi:tetratricopeptide (TPR) repeat protein
LPAKDYERLLLDSIDEALSSMEENLKKITYAQLESLGLPKYEIPRNIGAFTRVIETVFGAGADDIKISILKRLYEKNGWPFRRIEFDELTFPEQLERACGRLYSEIISNIQSPVAVFHLEDINHPSSLRLIAINASGARTTGVNAESTIRKTIIEVYPEISGTDVQNTIVEVIRSGRVKNLGRFQRRTGHGLENNLSATVFPFSSNCVGLVFKQAAERDAIDTKSTENEKRFEDDAPGVGEWRWESDTLGRQISADRSHARERWTRKEITHEPHRADYFSIRGKEYLESGDLLKAREFFRQAEDMYQRSNETEDAFKNASFRIRTYIFEEKIALQEYFEAVEEYAHKYADLSMHENFIENLAYYRQWKGYKYDEEHRFEDARASYAEAEEMFLALKQRNRALFNASRRVLTYKSENMMEMYEKWAEEFFDEYSEFSETKYCKEVRAHYYTHKADKSSDPLKTMEFRTEAERLFLEINQREPAFENACKLLDLYWENISSKDEQLTQRCLDATERFLGKYIDFSEHEYYRKRMAEYYLLQARTLASQLKQVLR